MWTLLTKKILQPKHNPVSHWRQKISIFSKKNKTASTTSNRAVFFSYKKTKIGLGVGAGVLVLSMCGTVILGMNSPKVIPGAYNSVETVASLNDLANGCGNTFSFTPTTDQAVIIPDEYYETLKIAKTKIPTHEMMIPVYGYMTEKGIPDDQKGYYEVNELKEPLNREQVLNSMYFDDTLVIWYSPDIRPSDIGDMLEAVEGETNIIIAPWEYEAGVLPAQRKVAFSYWGSSKTCEFFDSSSLRDFIQLHKDNPVPKSNHPIKLDPAVNGVLKEITVDDE